MTVLFSKSLIVLLGEKREKKKFVYLFVREWKSVGEISWDYWEVGKMSQKSAETKGQMVLSMVS